MSSVTVLQIINIDGYFWNLKRNFADLTFPSWWCQLPPTNIHQLLSRWFLYYHWTTTSNYSMKFCNENIVAELLFSFYIHSPLEAKCLTELSPLFQLPIHIFTNLSWHCIPFVNEYLWFVVSAPILTVEIKPEYYRDCVTDILNNL